MRLNLEKVTEQMDFLALNQEYLLKLRFQEKKLNHKIKWISLNQVTRI